MKKNYKKLPFKMESVLQEFINEIKDYIPVDKLSKFKKVVQKFEKETNLSLSIEWSEVEQPRPVKKKKVPADLKKRLFEIFEVEEVKFKINDKSSDEEIVDTCMKIFNYLDDIEKRNKGYYYNLGYLLSMLKSRYNNEKDFLAFAKEKFNRSKTIINDYIRFYVECNKYNILMTCNLSYRETMKNLSEIRDILDQ